MPSPFDFQTPAQQQGFQQQIAQGQAPAQPPGASPQGGIGLPPEFQQMMGDPAQMQALMAKLQDPQTRAMLAQKMAGMGVPPPPPGSIGGMGGQPQAAAPGQPPPGQMPPQPGENSVGLPQPPLPPMGAPNGPGFQMNPFNFPGSPPGVANAMAAQQGAATATGQPMPTGPTPGMPPPNSPWMQGGQQPNIQQILQQLQGGFPFH